MMKRDLRCAIVSPVALCAVAVATPAMAQIKAFDVPEQAAQTGIPEFARQADIQILVSEQSTQGVRTRAVKGRMSVDQALRNLIAGTGLQIASGDGRSYTLARAASVQQTGDESGHGEIVVTAQRREQRLQDVPVSVSVTTGETLARTNISSLQDLAARLPGVRLTLAPASSLLNIRGVGSGLNAGFEQAVGTFVDGVYRGRSRAIAAALFDVERVEVLKGPQTTFFGNNVIAGALNISSRKPNFEFGGNASVLYAAADGEYNAELGVDIPLSDTFAVRLAGKLSGMDGYVHNTRFLEDGPHNRDATGRISVRWEPSATWRTDFRADFGRMRDHPAPETDGCPPAAIYGAARGGCLRYLNSGQSGDGKFDYRTGGSSVSLFNYDFTELALTNSVDLGAVSVTSSTGYFEHKNQALSDASPIAIGGVGGGASPHTINVYEDFTQFSQELRLQSRGGETFDYMLGGYYAHEDLDTSTYSGLYFAPFAALIGAPLTPGTRVSFFVPARQKTENWSVFGSATIRPIERLSIDIGLRYSKVTKKAVRDQFFGTGGVAPDFIPGKGAFTPFSSAGQLASQAVLGGAFGNFSKPRRSDDKLMPSLKLSYKMAPDIMAYMSFTKGFKAGGYAIAQGKFEFAPENVDAYEAGFKARLFDRKVFTTLALFRSDYKDLQEATQNVLASGVVVQVISNAARSRAQGVEFSVDAKISSRLTIRADVAYLDSKYLSYRNAPCTVLGNLVANCIQDMSGKRRGFAPAFSGSAGLSYIHPIDDNTELRIDPLVYFSSHIFQSATADPLLSQSGYAKLDLRVGVGSPDSKWELALIGKNLTDRKTAAFRNQFAGAPGTIWLFPERRRSIAAQASVRF